MTWMDERLVTLLARREALAEQMADDQSETCEEVRKIKTRITEAQVSLNETHIEYLRSLIGGGQ